MAKDFKLDSAHDLAIEDGDFQFVADGTEVAQSWKIRLLWIQGEWYGNTAIGVPWFSQMFRLMVGPEAKRQIIMDLTRGTPGVKSIKRIDETRDGHTGFLALRIGTDYNTTEDLNI
jgi:hypothetical protein